MLTYYLNNTNSYTIRTENTSSNVYTMSMQDMYTLTNSTMSLSSASFTSYENLLAFTGSIVSASVGQELRLTLYSSGSTTPIWNSTIQVYQSQSIDKASYTTQNNQYISHISTNEYIIMN